MVLLHLSALTLGPHNGARWQRLPRRSASVHRSRCREGPRSIGLLWVAAGRRIGVSHARVLSVNRTLEVLKHGPYKAIDDGEIGTEGTA
jgi:hypothetical protein